MEETKDECGYLSQKEFWQLPEVIEQYKANDILNKDGGELYGVITHEILHLRDEQPSLEFFIQIFGFRNDGGIIENRITCNFDFDKAEALIGGVKQDDLLYTILDWGGYSGLSNFEGLKVKLKYEFNEKGLIIRELDPFDGYKKEYSLKLIYTNSECNTSEYNWDNDYNDRDYVTLTGCVFQYSSPIFVDSIKTVEYEAYSTSGSCRINETIPISKNELVKILGEPIKGIRFDKTINEWHVVMSVKQDSDIEGDDSINTTDLLFTLYDYKTYGKLGDDEPYRWHIGCGWDLKNIDKNKDKSPFEIGFNKNNKGELYCGGTQINPSTVFVMYLYNEVLKLRKQ